MAREVVTANNYAHVKQVRIAFIAVILQVDRNVNDLCFSSLAFAPLVRTLSDGAQGRLLVQSRDGDWLCSLTDWPHHSYSAELASKITLSIPLPKQSHHATLLVWFQSSLTPIARHMPIPTEVGTSNKKLFFSELHDLTSFPGCTTLLGGTALIRQYS